MRDEHGAGHPEPERTASPSRLVLQGRVTSRDMRDLISDLTGALPAGLTARDLAHRVPDVLTVDCTSATYLDPDVVAVIATMAAGCFLRGRRLTVVAPAGPVRASLVAAGVDAVVHLLSP